jgi:hypothetical protein
VENLLTIYSSQRHNMRSGKDLLAFRGKMRTLPLFQHRYIFRLCLKCDGTRAEIRFRLSAKGTSPFKLAGASVQSTARSRVVRISGSNAGYTMFRGSVKGTGYQLYSPVSPSLLSRASPCAITFQLDSTILYDVTTSYGLHGPGIESRWRRGFPQSPDWTWGPPSLL